MTQAVSSHESSSLANCRLLHVSDHCCLVFVCYVQEASVCACIYRSYMILYDIQPIPKY